MLSDVLLEMETFSKIPLPHVEQIDENETVLDRWELDRTVYSPGLFPQRNLKKTKKKKVWD